LKNRRIRFTATAQEHVRRENAWWLANRDNTGVFAEELEQALKIVATLPGAGTPHVHFPVPAFAASTSGESSPTSITRSMTMK
jgi:hypothetical protein